MRDCDTIKTAIGERGNASMTDLEILIHAKKYIDNLARGIDPLTGNAVPVNDIVLHPRISRCLYYVSDVLSQVIDNGGIDEFAGIELNDSTQEDRGIEDEKQIIGRKPFSISREDLKQIPLSRQSIPVTEITNRINALVENKPMRRLNYKSITSFLLKHGKLKTMCTSDGKTVKVPTEEGISLGIVSEKREGQNSTYYVTVYDTVAQQYIFDHIDEIIEINNMSTAKGIKKKASSTESGQQAEFQGQPWTKESNAELKDLYNKKVPIPEIARKLKRTDGAIRARLKKFGLLREND